MNPAIVASLHGVTVRYRSTTALARVSVTFSAGATGLLGPNGAGKSTLMLALLGIVRPEEGGRVEVLGLDAGGSRLGVRGRLGYVPEGDAWIPGLNVVASIAYCGELAGLPRGDALQRAHDVIAYVGLDQVRYRRAETLSTGLRQRLRLAQALVHDPDLLLLDEPTSGLDPLARDQMLALIADLRRRGVNLIVSSHLLPDVEQTCDRIVVLNAGRVMAAGALGEFSRPHDLVFEVRIKGDTTRFLRALAAIGVAFDAGEDDTIRVMGGRAGAHHVFAAAQRAGVQVRHCRQHVVTLEDIFRDLAGVERAT